MKRLLLVAFLLFPAIQGFSQAAYSTREGGNTLIGLYAGGGLATIYNYDVAPSVGFEFLKGIKKRTFIGADLFYQTYALYYDNEENGATHGTGIAGAVLRHASSFVYLAPKFEYGLGKKQRVHAYATLGVGFKVGGYDSLRKWDHTYTANQINNYDSSIDLSKNINTLLLRFSFGLKEYLGMGKHWHFTFTEDFGFITSSLTKTGDADAPARTQYSPQKLSPGYISLQIGISHSKNPSE